MQTYEPTASVSFKNVLFATDLSPASEKALQYALAFARDRAAVCTLHVSGRDEYQLLCPEAFSATFNRARDCRSATKVLNGLLGGLPSEVPVHGTKIWKIILDVAVRNETDLLVLGTHGRRGLKKLFFGSVAEEVLRDVACPVLTIGRDAKVPNYEGLKIETILLATDCNPDSLAPIYAGRLCDYFGASLVALHVTASVADAPVTNILELHKRLAAIAPEIDGLQKQPRFSLEAGEPATKILQVAGDLDADLIVLGARAPRDVRTAAHLPWATATQVIAGSACPVLTVRDAVPSSWNYSPHKEMSYERSNCPDCPRG